MRHVIVCLRGISPLFTDPMSRATLDGLRRKKPPQARTDISPKEECEGKVPTDPEGRIAIPIDNFYSCIVAAGQKVKIGKSQISTAERTDLYDLLTLKGEYIYLTDGNFIDGKPSVNGDAKQPSWQEDMRRGVGKQAKTPTAVCITRPRYDEWGFTVEFEYDNETVNVTNIVKLFEKAGATQGLGGFRPNKGRGRFGRFRIVGWHEKDIESKAFKVGITLNGQTLDSFSTLSNGERLDNGNGAPKKGGRKKKGEDTPAEPEPAVASA